MRHCLRAGLPSALLLLQLTVLPPLLAGQAAAPPTREGFVEAGNGVRLFYRLVGSGRDTLVVIHGGPGLSGDYFAHDLDPLTQSNHALLIYDQRGTGRSTLVTDSAALAGQRFVEDLEALRRHFKFEHVTMLGHSWGAGVAALYAARYPERVGRVVVVGGIPLTMKGLVETFGGIAAGRDSASSGRMKEWMAARVANPEDPVACREYYAIWFHPFFVDSAAAKRLEVCSGSPEARRNKIVSVDKYVVPPMGDYDWRPGLRTLTAATLVVHGEKEVIPLAAAREWVATLPNSRLLLMPGVGHFVWLEAPEPFFAAVDAFLKGGWPDGSAR